MKRLQSLQECKKQMIAYVPPRGDIRDMCPKCHVFWNHDDVRSDKVCTNCGLCKFYTSDTNVTVPQRSQYNRNNIHRYTISEHFAQTVRDFSCHGSRNIPEEILVYCKAALGVGPSVTSEKVFLALRSNGYRDYYQYKYIIACTLRGIQEFHLSCKETSELIRIYKLYSREFFPFQLLHNIGTYSVRGKMRMYWPMRFVLARMCEQIGRGELCGFIRGVLGSKRLEKYKYYWKKLQAEIDARYPKSMSTWQPLQQIQLKKSRHRPASSS